MVTFMLVTLAVLMLVTFWPKAGQPVGGVALAGAAFLAAPLGWVLAQTQLAGVGFALLGFALFVLVRWLRGKWQAQ